MPTKEEIVDLLDMIERQEQQIEELLSAAERERSGELSNWAPKEILAHTVDWTERILDNIQRALRGEDTIPYDNYLEQNDQDFGVNQGMTWGQSRERSIHSRQAIQALLADVSEADLLRTDLPPSENPRPLWQRLVDSAVEHARIHNSAILQELGHADEGLPVQEQITNRLLRLDPENPVWQGNVLYNLACLHALSGHTAEAIEELRQSLQLNPGLKEWSKEDSDLNTLRVDPAYRTLY